MSKNVIALILAAGKGTRMKSKLNKNLHLLSGKPLITYTIEAAKKIGAVDIGIIIGNDSELMRETLGEEYSYIYQKEQLGTGHAVMQAKEYIKKNIDYDFLILLGDGPLISSESLKKLLELHENADATLLTVKKENPYGYGRIIRDEEYNIKEIVEEKDATDSQKKIDEVWFGISCFKGEALLKSLDSLTNNNAQKEYYLTDTIKYLNKNGKIVKGIKVTNEEESLGINDRKSLAEAKKIINRNYLEELMLSGVTIIDPDSTHIESTVKIAPDTTILPFTYLTGNSTIGMDCEVGPYTHIQDTVIGNRSKVMRSSIFSAIIKDETTIGPYAYIRPETVVEKGAKVGQFVEVKKSTIGQGSKVPHLSYVGDTIIGKDVNIGAGTIVVNYDGFKKHQTIIGDESFVGCNVNLVAPVKIGARSLVAAGSTITKDVPPDALAIARDKQINKAGWAKKRREMRNKLKDK
ncbi:MAG: bifunctional UDP-N-acetylglucosamine diphosphorylase/glucosamine-1-phosphate N-acetyltransferase GlmU [Clostridia bacterium]